MLLIGIDRIKKADILLPAYDNSQGVTTAINLNLLHRINRELNGSLPVQAFRHVARWNDAKRELKCISRLFVTCASRSAAGAFR